MGYSISVDGTLQFLCGSHLIVLEAKTIRQIGVTDPILGEGFNCTSSVFPGVGAPVFQPDDNARRWFSNYEAW